MVNTLIPASASGCSSEASTPVSPKSSGPCTANAVNGPCWRALRGTLFRNGPGRFDRDGIRYRHWFDGDGLVQAWRLDDSGVTHEARFVRTHKYVAESEAGRFLVHGAGTTIPNPRPSRNGDDFNTANTAVIAHGGRLQALWEGGSAWNIDPDTLETRGVHTFRDDLTALPYSAHPCAMPTAASGTSD